MTVGILQPYLLPYVGYFQLIHHVDHLIVHDDCQFIKAGWINRNRFLLGPEPKLFTFPIQSASHTAQIRERTYDSKHSQIFKKFIGSIGNSYRRSVGHSITMQALDDVASFKDLNVSKFNVHSIEVLCATLGIETPITLSSQLNLGQLSGAEKVIALCKSLSASTYVNPSGGMEIYDKQDFASAGIDLRFLKSNLTPYAQHSLPFHAGLSIIDLMMFTPNNLRDFHLRDYELI